MVTEPPSPIQLTAACQTLRRYVRHYGARLGEREAEAFEEVIAVLAYEATLALPYDNPPEAS